MDVDDVADVVDGGAAPPDAVGGEPREVIVGPLRQHLCRRCGKPFAVRAAGRQRFQQDTIFCTEECKAAPSPLLPVPSDDQPQPARTLREVQRTLRDWVSVIVLACQTAYRLWLVRDGDACLRRVR